MSVIAVDSRHRSSYPQAFPRKRASSLEWTEIRLSSSPSCPVFQSFPKGTIDITSDNNTRIITVKDNGIGVSVLCPMVVETKLLSNSERIMGADYGLSATSSPTQPDTLNVDEVARLTVDAIAANRLYVLPHSAARGSIRRRFDRIDQTFEDQASDGWSH